MHIARIKNFDIANGRGIGVSVYVSGCRFRCPGCFNQEAWDFGYGTEYTSDTLEDVMQKLSNPHIDRLSILGGEPLDKDNLKGVGEIIAIARDRFPNKKIWLWTGYNENELNEEQKAITEECDCVTYGRFVEALKNIRRLYSGSDNQYTKGRGGDVIESSITHNMPSIEGHKSMKA